MAKSRPRNKYFRRSRRPRPPEFVKMEVWLPVLAAARLQRHSMDKEIPMDRLSTLALLRAIQQGLWDLFEVPEIMQTDYGSEAYPMEQDMIYKWLKGMGPYGFEYDELLSLCEDIGMTLLSMSYAINGLMDKKLIERRDNTFYVTRKQKTENLFRAVKGRRVIRRPLKQNTLFKKETRNGK